jgi:transposase
MATLSQDIREHIVAACDRRDGTRQEIAEHYGVSLGMVKKLLRQRNKTGDITARHRFSGAKPKISPEQQQRLRELAIDDPFHGLDYLRDMIGTKCTVQTIHHSLSRAGLSVRLMRKNYWRDQRALWRQWQREASAKKPAEQSTEQSAKETRDRF